MAPLQAPCPFGGWALAHFSAGKITPMRTVLAGLVVAVVAGAVGVAVVIRVRRARVEEDLDALRARLVAQMSGLEDGLLPSRQAT